VSNIRHIFIEFSKFAPVVESLSSRFIHFLVIFAKVRMPLEILNQQNTNVSP